MNIIAVDESVVFSYNRLEKSAFFYFVKNNNRR